MSDKLLTEIAETIDTNTEIIAASQYGLAEQPYNELSKEILAKMREAGWVSPEEQKTKCANCKALLEASSLGIESNILDMIKVAVDKAVKAERR